MKKKYFLSVLILVLSLSKNCFAKENSNVMPFFPGDTQEDPKIKTMAQAVKDFPYYSQIARYLSVYAEDPAPCQKYVCNNPTEKYLWYLRYVGEGRCGEIKIKGPGDGMMAPKIFCEGLKKGSCNNLDSSTVKNAGPNLPIYIAGCNAYINEDVEQAIQSRLDSDKTQSYDVIKAWTLRDMGIVAGYKKYSMLACQRFLNKIDITDKTVPLIEQVACCKVLFSENPEVAVESILKDIALFDLAKKENNPDYCDKITESKIKTACRDPRFKNQDSLFGK